MTAGAAYITGTQLQGVFSLPFRLSIYKLWARTQCRLKLWLNLGLIALNKADYVYEAWHGTLLTIASATFTLLFNIFLVRKLPLIEGILVVIHIFGFFGVVVTLWVMSPTGDPKTVFVRITFFFFFFLFDNTLWTAS